MELWYCGPQQGGRIGGVLRLTISRYDGWAWGIRPLSARRYGCIDVGRYSIIWRRDA